MLLFCLINYMVGLGFIQDLYDVSEKNVLNYLHDNHGLYLLMQLAAVILYVLFK
jgi:hypothetical protein